MNQQDIILKKAFHEEMIALYKRIVKELKYKSPRLLEMINKYGGYEAAIKILPTDAHTFDFTLLWEQQRLDLSIEALVTKEKYQPLFPDDVVKLCQRRLDEYNYAPNHIEEEVEEEITPFVEDLSLLKEELLNMPKEQEPEPLISEDYMAKPILAADWADLFMKTTIFTKMNQDLILKMYSLGSLNITPELLAELEGYSSKYPFYEVILSLCKRIKAALKIEVPKNDDGKLLWWQLLFTGYYENNQKFCFNLRIELDQALTMLMEEKMITQVEREQAPNYETLEVEAIFPPTPVDLENEEAKASKKSIFSETGQLPSLDDFIDFLIDDTPKEVKPAPTQTQEQPQTQTPSKPPMMAYHSDTHESEAFESEKQDEIVADEVVVEVERQEEIPVIPTAPVKVEPITEVLPESTAEEVSIDVAPKEIVSEVAPETNTIWEEKKAECLSYYGAVCDLCGFDFGYTYGLEFEGLIEVHNLQPEKNLESIDPHQDLIPICRNCKTVLHARTPHFTVEEVKTFIAKAQDAE